MLIAIKPNAEVVINGTIQTYSNRLFAYDARRNLQSGCIEFTLRGQHAYVMDAADCRLTRCPTCGGEGDCPDCEVVE